VPEFPDKGAIITARQLLCHQSGIPHYSNGLIVPTDIDYNVPRPFLDPVHGLAISTNFRKYTFHLRCGAFAKNANPMILGIKLDVDVTALDRPVKVVQSSGDRFAESLARSSDGGVFIDVINDQGNQEAIHGIFASFQWLGFG
jgi:hypothetical protein